MSGNLMSVRGRVLQLVDSANGQQLPFKPSEHYRTVTIKLAADGFLDRGQMGGFWLNAAGRRLLRIERRVIASPDAS